MDDEEVSATLLLSVEQVAEIFAVNPDTVRLRIRRGQLPAEAKFGLRHAGYRIPARALIAWCEERNLPVQGAAVRAYIRRHGLGTI